MSPRWMPGPATAYPASPAPGSRPRRNARRWTCCAGTRCVPVEMPLLVEPGEAEMDVPEQDAVPDDLNRAVPDPQHPSTNAMLALQ